MITGTVNTDSEAVIRLVVQGPAGHVHEIEAIIDTGFNGFLTLPSALVTMLGLTRLSRGRALLANDSDELFDIQIRESKFTAVLLTPNSVDKPWLMWEAGAVSGVSLATREASTVIPIVYRLSMEQMPSPLRSRQAAFGEDCESIGRGLETLKQSTPLPAAAFTEFVKLFVPRYLENVARALAETPPPLTESAVHDWLDRITYFERTDRRSGVGQLHRAMVNVFAPGDNAFETPLDVRLHRRLGDITSSRNGPRKRRNSMTSLCGCLLATSFFSIRRGSGSWSLEMIPAPSRCSIACSRSTRMRPDGAQRSLA